MNPLTRRLRATESEIKKHADAAIEIADTANAEDRSLSDEEKQSIQGHKDAIDRLKVKTTEIESEIKLDQDIREASKSIKVTDRIEAPKEVKSIGEQFVESEAFQKVREKGFSGDWKTDQVGIETKATLTSTTGGDLVQPQVQAGVVRILSARLTVRDLLSAGRTNSSTVRYLQESVLTNAAAAVAEGAAKPESTIEFEAVDEPVRKIATILPIADEMLEDAPQLQSYINERLAGLVAEEEEDQLLNGNGTAPNVSGLLDRTGIQTQDIDSDALEVAIFKAIGLVRNNSHLEPDGVVVNPADWETIRLATDTNGQYFGGGPFYGPYGGPQGGANYAIERLWGLPVVVTPAIAEGTTLVGAFRTAAQVFQRSGITLDATNSHADYFAKNLTVVRAEERLALAVYRPAAFAIATQVA